MSNKNDNSSDVIVKLVVFIGAIAAIAVAAMVFVKKFNKKTACECDDGFSFDDEDFCDDYDCCCDCDDCSDECECEEQTEE